MKPALRAECIRLRLEERLSFREIQTRTGASKGSLSIWLKEYPLDADEIAARQAASVQRQRSTRRASKSPRRQRSRDPESQIHGLVRANGLSPLQVSHVSEAAVMLRMLVHGLTVFRPAFDGCEADWLVSSRNTPCLKVQVKTAAQQLNGGQPVVQVTHGHGRGARRYQAGSFDFLVGYDLFTDRAYVWSWAEIEHIRSSITVHPNALERWDKILGQWASG
jgi:hypothetical protein